MQRNKRFVKIREILYSFDVIYREINEYNTTYWGKFLFIFWSLFGSIVILYIYIIFYSNLNIILKFFIFYAMMSFSFLFNFILSKVCSLNSEANKSYKIFHSFIIQYSKTYLSLKIFQLHNKINVIIIELMVVLKIIVIVTFSLSHLNDYHIRK